MSRFQCPRCGFVYDEQAGHPHDGFKPGTPWGQVPGDWRCPDCAVSDRVDFVAIGQTPPEATKP